MKRLVTQKFKYMPSHYLFHYEGKTYIRNDIGLVVDTDKDSIIGWKDWEYGPDALVLVDTESILLATMLGPDVCLHKVSTDAEVFGLEGLDEPIGELRWVNGVFHWGHVVFLPSQVVHVNQVSRTIYIEV